MDSQFQRKKILICGGSSLLTYLWCNSITNDFEILITRNKRKIDYLKIPSIKVDLLSSDSIIRAITENSIDIVINTVGLTNVEQCERYPEEAFLLNGSIPGYIAKACNTLQKKFIHISTDHFFNDEKVKHTENDNVFLINTYAKSKFDGELNVLYNMPSALVCRTNFFGYGPVHKNSFSDWIIKSVKDQKIITLHDDVFYTPINGNNLAYFAHKLLDLNCSGIYNICSNQALTKYEFGMLLCKTLNISSEYIKAGLISSRNELVIRPTSMALSNKKMCESLNVSVETIINQIRSLKI